MENIRVVHRKSNFPPYAEESKIRVINENGCACPQPGLVCCFDSVTNRTCPLSLGGPPKFEACPEKRGAILKIKEQRRQ